MVRQNFCFKQGEYAGPYKLAEQWYFFQIKTAEEIKAEEAAKEAEEKAQETTEEETQSEKPEETLNEEQATEPNDSAKLEQETAFTAVASTVRSYIESIN